MPWTAPRFARRLRRAAEQTPERRNRYIDALRALAILTVVLGHWLAALVTTNGRIGADNALAHILWAQPLTWFFQVMPVFFLVGGYSHAASLTSHYRKGGDAFGWVLGRTDRLLRPTTAFLVALWAGALAARLAGADPWLVGLAVWGASIPLWFLAAYIGVVVFAPLMFALHRRAGAAVPVVLVGLVLALDTARLGFGVPVIGEANYLLVWLAIHQFGFWWRDRWEDLRPLPPALTAAAGLLLLLALTTVGPYPLSMVDVPGAELGNASPPTFALLVLGLTQASIALALQGPAQRGLRRIGPWTAVVAVNAVVLTLFLWHMAAAIVTGAALYPTGVLPQPAVGSAEWLLLRVPWLLAVGLVLAVFVAVFGRVESRTAPSSAGWRVVDGAASAPGVWAWRLLVAAAFASLLGGLLWIALAGPGDHGMGGLPTAAFLAYAAGAAVLRLMRERWSRISPER